MKKVILGFCLSVVSLGVIVQAQEAIESQNSKQTKLAMQKVENEREKTSKMIKGAHAKDKLLLKYDDPITEKKVIYMQEWLYHDNGKLSSYTYGKVIDYKAWQGALQKNTMTIRYDERGRMYEQFFYGSKGHTTFSDTREYYSSNVLKYQWVYHKTLEGVYKGGKEYKNNTKKRLTYYAVTAANYIHTKEDKRTYYPNNQLNKRIVLNRTKTGNNSALYVTKMRKNNTKDIYIRGYFNKKGINTKNNIFKYNRSGKLKTNKNGKAYKYAVIPNKRNRAITTNYRAQYNKKGKLSKAKRIKSNTLTKSVYWYLV